MSYMCVIGNINHASSKKKTFKLDDRIRKKREYIDEYFFFMTLVIYLYIKKYILH